MSKHWEKHAPPPLEPPGYCEPPAASLTPASAFAPLPPTPPRPCCHHDHHEHHTYLHERDFGYLSPQHVVHPVMGYPMVGYTYRGTVVTSPGGPLIVSQPTDAFCPATGGGHIVRRRQGAVSILLTVFILPVGLFTLPFDRKKSCRKCNYVLREAWGGC